MKIKLLIAYMLIAYATFGQFAPYRNISPTVTTPSWLTNADLDGDGDDDIIHTNLSQKGIAYYENLNQSDDFSQQRMIISDHNIRMVQPADIDNDGDMDLIAVSRFSNLVIWFEHLDGQGNFGPDQIISDQVESPECIYGADIDGDGDIDIITASKNDNKVAWYENIDGQGDFGNQQIISSTASGTRFAYPADIDGDGDVDVVATLLSDNLVVWYENSDGLGDFSDPIIISDEHERPLMVVATDVEGDGDMDLIISTNPIFIDATLVFQENLGGTFATADVLFEEGANSSDELYFDLGDLDGDGDDDILLSDPTQYSEIRWFRNNGSSSFAGPIKVDDDVTSPKYVTIIDIDDNGIGDPVVTMEANVANGANQITWYRSALGQSTYYVSPNLITSDIDEPRKFIQSDMDGDGDLDIVVASHWDALALWYENRDAIFDFGQPHPIYEGGLNSAGGVKAFNVADIDNDGDNDVILSQDGFQDNPIRWFENDGEGNFSNDPNLIIAPNIHFSSIVGILDVNNNGFIDLIYHDRWDNDKLILKINDGTGNLALSAVIAEEIEFPDNIQIHDVDNDGYQDVIVSSSLRDYIKVFNNLNGYTQWENTVSIDLDNVKDIALGDLDNDGDPEIVANNSNDIFWYDNEDNSPDFLLGQELPFSEPFSVEIGDMDEDGFNDIVFGEDGISDLGWFKNLNGTGNFVQEEIEVFDNNSSGLYIQLGDLDLDGDLDISFVIGGSTKWIPSLMGEPFQVTGNIFFDENENGIKDNEESDVKNRAFTLAPLNFTTWSNDAGNYAIPTSIGDFELTCKSKENWKFTTDSIIQVVVDGNADSIFHNFGVTVSNPIQEADVYIHSGITRCGFEVEFHLDVVNTGNLKVDGIYCIELDTLVTFVSSSIPTDSIVGEKLYWSFEKLIPTGNEGVELTLLMPDENFDGVFLNFQGSTSLIDDMGMIYYTDTTEYISEISCAIDPNDKLVTPNIPTLDNYTLFGETLKYTIRFQNTGSDTAINIRVSDVLDPLLDWSTFEVTTSSHPYVVSFSNEGIVDFNFPNIYLPDSSTNLIESQGFISYRINPLPDLEENTFINNEANIFFDFNDPILTNTTTNVLVSEYPLIITQSEPNCYDGNNGFITVDFPLDDLSYQWSSGESGKILENLIAGEYTVSVTNTTGQLVADTTITLTNPPEIILVGSTTNEIGNSENGTATVTATGGTPPFTYFWNTSPAQTTSTAIDLSGGDYEVSVTDANGCMETMAITVETIVGTIDPSEKLIFEISPNPGKTNIGVYFEFSSPQEWSVTFYNNLGQLVKSFKSNQKMQSHKLWINDLPAGHYSVRLEAEEHEIIRKFIVVK